MNMIVIFILIGILFLSIVVTFRYLNAKINILDAHMQNSACKCSGASARQPQVPSVNVKKVRFAPVVNLKPGDEDEYSSDGEIIIEDDSTEEIEEIEEYDEEELDEILSDDVHNIK